MMEANCAEFGIPLYGLNSAGQGIVHVIGPELGLTQPGMTIVCGDSHTSTHGAFGALAFGIGTSEVEHVLATQCLLQREPKTMEIRLEGQPARLVSPPKISSWPSSPRLAWAAAPGHVLEYTGAAIRALDMEARMTICNMSIEAGARAGMIAPDETTFEYLRRAAFCPRRARTGTQAVARWRTLPSDPGAQL